MSLIRRLAASSVLLLATGAEAQSTDAWEACVAQPDAALRLACYDRWATGQRAAAVPSPAAPAAAAAPAPSAPRASETPSGAGDRLRLTTQDGCRQQGLTALSRLWELEAASDCGTCR